MGMVDDKISPEEKLLQVIKGDNVAVQSNSKTGIGSSVVPPLSSVLESIINAPSPVRSGLPVAPAVSSARMASSKPLSYQEQQTMIRNLATTYSVAVQSKSSPVPVPPVVTPVFSSVPKPQPVVQPVVPVKTATATTGAVQGSVKNESVSSGLPEQKAGPTAVKAVVEAMPIASKTVPAKESPPSKPGDVSVATSIAPPVSRAAMPVIPSSGVVQPVDKSAISPPATKVNPVAPPASKPVVPPPAAQPIHKSVSPPVAKVEQKPVTAAPVQSVKSEPQAVKEQPKPVAATPLKAVAPPSKPEEPAKLQPASKVESKTVPPQPAAPSRAQVSPSAVNPAEVPKPKPSVPVVPPQVAVASKSVEVKTQPKPEIKPATTVTAKPSAPPEKPKVAASASVEEKPKLKVAKSDTSAVQDIPKSVEAKVNLKAVSVEDPGDVALPPPVIIAKKPEEKKKHIIRNVNLGLVAAILLLIAFSVSEIFAKLRTDEQLSQVPDAVEPVDPDQNGQDLGQIYKLPALETIVQAMGDRPMLSMPGQRLKETPAEGPEKAPQVMDWMKYVQDSIKLMGFSGSQAEGTQQAIIQEGKDKDSRINFFKPGQKVQIQGRDIQVESIRDDQVILTDGKRKMTLK
ncbi:MAG: hypothetical protein A2283_17070 [Lentisphaerae bacterium RIFOXYA12_FULL_48_11]|nr:MAG: hypothetical protein A2283_17070 [Lentisphaerae bacterium RIFOXYA12_FULL_48_11]